MTEQTQLSMEPTSMPAITTIEPPRKRRTSFRPFSIPFSSKPHTPLALSSPVFVDPPAVSTPLPEQASTPNEDATKFPSPGHSARVLYALVTGLIPSPPTPSAPKSLWRKFSSSAPRKEKESSEILVIEKSGEVSEILKVVPLAVGNSSGSNKKRDPTKPVPNVPPKSLAKLKKSLMDPDEARKIITDLHRMEIPPSTAPICPSSSQTYTDCNTHTPTTRGYELPLLPLPPNLPSPPPEASDPTSPSTPPEPAFSILNIPTSYSSALVSGVKKSGAFNLAADLSGALIHQGEKGIVPPRNRIGVFVYWWGYELSIPTSELATLKQVNSIQSYFFSFLQAFVVAGGAPELGPFIRYLATYVDMEFSGILSQDKGRGVVVAATWLIPVALVPRPWDFPSA